MHRAADARRPSEDARASVGPPWGSRTATSDRVTRIDALVGVGGVIVLVVLFVVETRAPLRRRVRPRGERLAVNVVLAVSAGLVVRLAVVAVGLAVAAGAERGGVGLLHWVALPRALAGVGGPWWVEDATRPLHRPNHTRPRPRRPHL